LGVIPHHQLGEPHFRVVQDSVIGHVVDGIGFGCADAVDARHEIFTVPT
jgi:hypothetical protein